MFISSCAWGDFSALLCRKGTYLGVSMGFTMGFVFLSYAVAFYYGSWLIEWGLKAGWEVSSQFMLPREISIQLFRQAYTPDC